MIEETVFEVEYYCNNCTKEFKKKYTEDVDIEEWFSGVRETRPPQTFMQRLFRVVNTSRVRCSNCNSAKVEIEDRGLIE